MVVSGLRQGLSAAVVDTHRRGSRTCRRECPFALGIAWFANRTAVRQAVYVTLLYPLIGPILYLPFSWNAPSFAMFAAWGADVAKQHVCLPLLSLWFSAILKKCRAANKVTDRVTPTRD